MYPANPSNTLKLLVWVCSPTRAPQPAVSSAGHQNLLLPGVPIQPRWIGTPVRCSRATTTSSRRFWRRSVGYGVSVGVVCYCQCSIRFQMTNASSGFLCKETKEQEDREAIPETKEQEDREAAAILEVATPGDLYTLIFRAKIYKQQASYKQQAYFHVARSVTAICNLPAINASHEPFRPFYRVQTIVRVRTQKQSVSCSLRS